MNIYLELLFLVLCATIHTSAGNKSRQDVLKQILKNYDPDVYPNDREGNQTEVTVQMTIADIDQINDQSEEFEMILYLRMEWYDPRLQFENETDISFTSIELTGDKTSKVWLPDLFFDYERKTSNHGIMGPEKLIYIYKDGNITFSERITMTTECVMDFKNFPFDEQNCILHLESYAYTTRSLVLKWAEPNDVAVQNLDTNTPYYIITQIKTTSGVNIWSSFSIYQENRNFSFLNVTLTLERISSVYGFTYFGTFPVYATMVLLSFGLKDTGPRVTACSSAIAAVGLQWIAVYSKLPSIPHYTVIDQWILGHLLFMWLAIVYHVLVHIKISTHQDQRKRFHKHSEISPPDQGSTGSTKNSEDNSRTSFVSEWKVTLKKAPNEGPIKHETELVTKRSFKEFRLLDKYLKSKNQSTLVESSEESRQVDKWIKEMSKSKTREKYSQESIVKWIVKMEELIQPEKIKDQYKDKDDVLKVVQAFIADGKWKCTAWFSEKWERLKARLPSCDCSCMNGLKSRLSNCKKSLTECLSSCKRKFCSFCCCCCKDTGYKVLLKQQKDGSIILVGEDNEQETFINRSFEDFYYLQTYLQAKYPDYKWPSLPLHNVLTIDDQKYLTKMREKFISDMVQLLQPTVWSHHSEIEKDIQTFTAEEKWHGSKFYSHFRRHILFYVNSAGHQTGPDLGAFILFCIGYSLFVFFLLHDRFEKGKLLYLVFVGAFILLLIVIYKKNASMKPPVLWHTHAEIKEDTAKIKKDTDRDDLDDKNVNQPGNSENRVNRTGYNTLNDPNIQEQQPNPKGNSVTDPLFRKDE